MKQIVLIICCTGLLVLMTLTSSYAGKPVDGDGDGYSSNQDCNDADASIWELNSCGSCEIEPVGGCDAPTCTDNDSDSYAIEGDTCGPVDCNDNDDTIYPGATETCGDGIDQSCSGSDLICPNPDDPHTALSWSEYPANCISCHDGDDGGHQYDELLNTTHYNWVGATPDMINQQGSPQGKLNGVNSYCINIEGDWPVCGSCHIGRGEKPGEETAGVKQNIDCLMCHNEDYALNRARIGLNSMGPTETDPLILDSYVQNIAPPTRTNCLKCHAYAGGGDALKRGDLSSTLYDNTDPHFDVHMNSAGPNLQCQDCHKFENHKVIGKGSDLRPTDDPLRNPVDLTCANAGCHTNMDSGSGHNSAGRNDAPDRHVARVACQSCHIPEYAKDATEIHRDWEKHHDADVPEGISAYGCGVNGADSCAGHPHVVKASNLIPELKFWNRLSDNYLLGDNAEVTYDTDKDTYPTSRPTGDINDGKLTPFKYKTANQPITRIGRQLIALDTLVYIKETGNVEEAIESGLFNMGLPIDTDYDWIETDTFQMINHGVNPVSDVADCTYCHQSNLNVDSDSMLDALGYKLKGVKEVVCGQCHDGGKKLPRTVDKMHNHIDKGSTGIGCNFCHDIERPERSLCDVCDPMCASEYTTEIDPLSLHGCPQ